MKINNDKKKYVLVGLFLIFPGQVFAYIDPGSGSLILQGIIAGIAMGLYTIKLYWYKFKSLFSKSKESEKNDLDIDEKD